MEPLLAMPPPKGVAILEMSELFMPWCLAIVRITLSAQLHPPKNFDTALFAMSFLLVCKPPSLFAKIKKA
jgi:hypothetical protein